jgi:hypothetical protein
MLTFEELKTDDCRWPVAEAIGEILFCGEPAIHGCPYCAAHPAIAYKPAARRFVVCQEGYEETTPAALNTTEDDRPKIVKTGA